METSADCVIVGGGIGGAVLALALGRKGLRVVICEREEAPRPIGRPEILAASTIQSFRDLGVPEEALGEAVLPLQEMVLYLKGGRRALSFTPEVLARAGVRPHSTDPGRTRQALLETAGRVTGVRVERGVEILYLLREEGRFTGVRGVRAGEPVSIRAPLVVGDDGAQSRIRTAAGIPLKAVDFPLVFLGAVGPALPELAPAAAQVWLDPSAVRRGLFGGLFLPLPQGRMAMVFPLSAAWADRFKRGDPSRFYDAAARLSPLGRSLRGAYRFPEAFTVAHRVFGHAPRYAADGIVLLGDAAHPVTPVGGQGANMSVADALVLADIAVAALRAGDCSAGRLAAYERQRRPANAQSLQFSEAAFGMLRVLRAAPWLAAWLLPQLLARVERREETKVALLRQIAEAFLTRPEGPA